MVKFIRVLVVLCFVIGVSCSEEDLKINEGVIEEETLPIEKIGIIDSTSFMVDVQNSLIVYNGTNLEFDSLLVVSKDTFLIRPNDSELLLGKSYQLEKDSITFNFYRTEIPIVILDTQGSEIPDEPKIGGTLNILNEGEIEFSSFMGIELRGGLSQTFPKKSYSVELWEDSVGEDDIKERLLSMRNDDDWILDGLWNEPLRIRDYTSHDLWLKMARYNYKDEEPETTLGINRKYCEVFLNGAYRGIYYLGEKVDRKQLNLKDYEGGIRGELYKGDYWADGVLFEGVEEFSNVSEIWSGYEAKYPDDIGEIDWANLHDLVAFVVNSDETTFNGEVGSRFDIQNVVDYFLFMNITYATDNMGKNLYTAKYNEQTPYFFVAWDMDGTFGNNSDGERLSSTDGILSNGLYNRLVQNPMFVSELKERWNSLKLGTLSETNLNAMFVDNYTFLKNNGAYERERLDENLPFNYTDSEITYITNWNSSRRVFLDTYINGL